jgi:hypothetical protein
MLISSKRIYAYACLALMLLEASCASAGSGVVPGNLPANNPSFANFGAAAPAGKSKGPTIIGCKIVTPKQRIVLNPPPPQTFKLPPGFDPSEYVFYFEIGIGNWCYSLPQPLYTTVPGRATKSKVRFEGGHNKLVLNGGTSYVYAAYAVPATPGRFIYVIDHGTSNISVWPTGANGNVAPIYRIMNVGGIGGAPQGIAEDAKGYIYVTTIAADGITTSLLVYKPGAHGNAKPIRAITGPDTTLTNNSSDTGVGPDGSVYVNNGNGIAVFAPNADGDSKPVRLIAGLNGGGAAVSPSNFLYTSTAVGSSGSQSAIYGFGPNANGNTPPLVTLEGKRTNITTTHITGVDSQGNIYMCDDTAVIEFAPFQQGNVFPIRNVSSKTNFVGLQPIAIDGAANVFVGDEDGARLFRFEPYADGDAAPAATIAGSNTGLINPAAMAVGR